MVHATKFFLDLGSNQDSMNLKGLAWQTCFSKPITMSDKSTTSIQLSQHELEKLDRICKRNGRKTKVDGIRIAIDRYEKAESEIKELRARVETLEKRNRNSREVFQALDHALQRVATLAIDADQEDLEDDDEGDFFSETDN